MLTNCVKARQLDGMFKYFVAMRTNEILFLAHFYLVLLLESEKECFRIMKKKFD
jgi:hypothetical protein